MSLIFRIPKRSFAPCWRSSCHSRTLSRELLKIEIENLALYGYGIKGYILSMIETALKVTDNTITNEAIEKIIGYGKELLNEPIELLDNVEEVLKALQGLLPHCGGYQR